jgi:two-component system, NtrC family, nitrogen regulation sensor histidine kinase GlnL
MVDKSHYRQILDNLLSAIIVLDQNLHITFVNSAAEMLLGVSSEQVLNKPVTHCFHNLDEPPEALADALAENLHFTMRRAHWRLHNLHEITVDYSVSPNPELKMLVIEAHSLDRLLRINREEAMLSTQETSRNLVRSLAHEIKNPLSGIRGAAQLLARELSSTHEGFEEYTRVIIDETDRLRNLVDRMLGPHRPVIPKPTNVHEVLEHVMSVLKAETNNQLKFARDYDPSIPEVPGDRELLIQAILNIARNAVQVLQESGRTADGVITFRTRVQRRYTIGRKQHPLVARLVIIDNGPGIPADLIEDIFFPMITGRAEGTGLGLAIAQNLIGQHGGIIECESEPGRTEFSIYLPLDYLHAEA